MSSLRLSFTLTLAAALAQVPLKSSPLRAQSPAQLLPSGLFATVDPSDDDDDLLDLEPTASVEARRESPETARHRSDPPRITRRTGVSIDLVDTSGYTSELVPETKRLPLPPFHPLDLQISYDVCPSFVNREPFIPVLDVRPPRDNPQERGVKNLAKKEFFRQVRRHLKKGWRTQLRELPNLRYESYETRMLMINGIGKDLDSFEQSAGDYYTSEIRENVFQRGLEGEEELAVLRVGPLTLLDSGGIQFDLRRIQDLATGKSDEPEPLEVAPSNVRRPLFSGENYRVTTRVRCDVDPFRFSKRGEIADILRTYGGTLEVAWLTDILKRERFVTECEAQIRHSETVLFFNLVMKSR